MQPFGYEEKEKEIFLIGEGEKFTSSKLKKYWKNFYGEDVLVKNMDIERKEKLMAHLIEKGELTATIDIIKGKVKNVMAFDDDNFEHIEKSKIDWKTMTDRNIYMKLDTIFTAMGWSIGEVIHEKM